jgi:hypothetical protein
VTMTRLLLIGLSVWPQPQQEVQPPPQVLAACASISTLLSEGPVDSLHRSNTIVEDERTRRKDDGCRVQLVATTTAFANQDSPDQRVRAVLPTLGWEEDWHYAADGPDGTAFALRKEAILCLVRASWDGGDIVDPTYVPGPQYELVIRCLEAPHTSP